MREGFALAVVLTLLQSRSPHAVPSWRVLGSYLPLSFDYGVSGSGRALHNIQLCGGSGMQGGTELTRADDRPPARPPL